MKKVFIQILMTISIVILLIACNNTTERDSNKNNSIELRQNEAAKKKEEEATKLAEHSKDYISDIPLGFKYRMTKNEVSNLLRKLQHQNMVTHDGYEYTYYYNTTKGEKIKLRLDFRYFENKLETVYFHPYGYTIGSDRKKYEQETLRALDIDLTEKFDSTYKKISYFDIYSGMKSTYKKWFKKNQIIILHQSTIGVYLAFKDAPISKIAFDKDVQDIMNNSNQSWRKPRGSEYKDIGKLIVKNNIKVCGEYYVNEETSGEYIIACSPDGINWHYFVAYTKIGKFYRASDEMVAKLAPPR